MQQIWDWLRDANNQGALKLIGGGVTAVVVAGWVYYQWTQLHPDAEVHGARTVISNYSICRGEEENKCGLHTLFIGCSDVKKLAKDICGDYAAESCELASWRSV